MSLRHDLCDTELERHADLTLKSTWRHKVSAAKSGLKVIERHFIGQIDNCESECQFGFLSAQEIVCPGT
jgi:hypothetical protein